jgi:hypothetical protein
MGVRQKRDAPGKASPLKTLFLLLGLNAVPLGAAFTVFVLREQGKITIRAIPQESVGTIFLMGAVVLGIVALGWVVFPPLLGLRRAARKRASGTFGFIFRGLGYFLLLDLVAVALLVLALATTELVLLARLALSLRGV